MRPIFFNGKFYGASRMEGVHRVADRLVREVDKLLRETPAANRPAAKIFLPEGSSWKPQFTAISAVEEKTAGAQWWEQFILPWRARRGVLVNLCNLAPVFHFRKITMLHDVQHLFPGCSYTLRQKAGYRLLFPIVGHSSRLVLTVSHYSRQLLAITNVAPYSKTMVIHNGADHILDIEPNPDALRRLSVKAREYCLLFGSAQGYKNNAVIFEAFADPTLKTLKLVVVGPGKADLARAGLTAPANALFAGRIDDGELRALYESALCLVFPSTTEGFGLPPLEAMLCGCPAIVAPAGAMPETCHDSVTYADMNNPSEWVGRVRRFADQPDYRKQKCEAGKQRAMQFTWSTAGKRLLAAIMELCRD